MPLPLNDTFTARVRNLLPRVQADALINALAAQEPVTSVRFNDAKATTAPQHLEQVPWCTNGFYLSERPQFTFHPAFHGGGYYVQDASSMFIHHVIKHCVSGDVRYLDLCAAPGGKTTAALQTLSPGSLVVANELMPARAAVLCDNIAKWGCDNCVVTNDRPLAFGRMAGFFDVIAADVPCSGEGMFRKEPEALSQWSLQLVDQCAATQKEILTHAWSALKPGGLLIYSTCTFNTQENEQMVDFIASELGATVIEVPVDENWGIAPAVGRDYPAYRFLPGITRGEGLFMAILRKNGAATPPAPTKMPKPAKGSLIPTQVKQWLSGDFVFTANDNRIHAVRPAIAAIAGNLQQCVKVIKPAGVEVAAIKGRNCVPSHELAMSARLNRNAFELCEVDYPAAIGYLRGEAITVRAPRGYVLVTFEGLPLGFANNLGNRANNLYPKSLRILSTHAPHSCPELK